MLLIVTGDRRLLLHLRADKPEIAHPGCWAGFGGGVKEGESVEDALRREVMEEIGIEVKNPMHLVDVIDDEGDGRVVSLFFVVGGIEASDIELHEGAGIGVHRIDELDQLAMPPFVRRSIHSHLVPALADFAQ